MLPDSLGFGFIQPRWQKCLMVYPIIKNRLSEGSAGQALSFALYNKPAATEKEIRRDLKPAMRFL